MDHVPDPDAAALRALGAVRGRGLAMFTGWRVYSMRPSPTRITSTPQYSVRIERLLVAPGSGDRWIIDRLTVGNLVVIDGPINATEFDPTRNPPGSYFAAPLTVMAGVNVSLDVRYVGDEADGEQFQGVIFCRRDDSRVVTLPVSSGRKIGATHGLRVLVGLDDKTWMFEEHGGQLANVYPRLPEADQSFEMDVDDDRDREQPRFAELSDPLAIERFQSPVMVALHVAQIDLAPLPRRVLFGTDERTGQVVFEVGDSADLQQAPSFAFKFRLDGYKPWWWERWTLLETDLLVPA